MQSAYDARFKEDYIMAKKSAGEFRNGMTLEIEGKVYQVIEFLHVNPGKGAAFVRTKLRNVIDGGIAERTFRPTETYDEAYIERKKMQYLYNDGDLYYFMDQETYDQVPVSADIAVEALKFVKENEEVTVMFYQGNAFSIEPPLTVELLITESEPGVKGNTATGATKPATLETGAVVQVPLFVEQGEVIKVDTRTGEYLSRA